MIIVDVQRIQWLKLLSADYLVGITDSFLLGEAR